MVNNRWEYWLSGRSTAVLYGMLLALLTPLIYYAGRSETGGTAGELLLFGLCAFVIGLQAVNCLFAATAYGRKQDKQTVILGVVAVLLAGAAIAGAYNSFWQVPLYLLAFGAMAAALVWREKRVLVAILTGTFLLAIAYSGLSLVTTLERIWLWSLPVIFLTVALLQLTRFRQYGGRRNKFLRVLLISGCSSMAAVMVASNAAAATWIAVLSLVYQSLTGIVLFLILKEWLIQFPVRAHARLHRLRQAALAKQKAQFSFAEQGCRLEKTAMANIGRAITGSGKLTGFLEQIVSDAERVFDADHVFVSLLEGQPQLLWVVAYKSSILPVETSLENKFMGIKYAQGQVVDLDDIEEFLPRLRPEIARAGLKAMIGVPILVEGKLAGTLELFSNRRAGFSENQKNLASFYAEQIAIAVKIDRLQEVSVRKSDELALLHEVMRVVTDQPSPTMLLAKIGSMLNDFLRADAFAAFVVQRHLNPPLVRSVHAQDFAAEDVRRLEQLFAKRQLAGLKQDSPANEHFAKLLQPVLMPLTLVSGKTVSVMPLFFRHTLQGVIVFLWDYDRKANRYSHTEATLATIATQVAMGLDRDYLYGSIQKIGLTDNLTGIANRRFFDYTLKRELLRVRRYGRPLSLLMIDIDFFKKINDQYGHPAGDAVLQEMGKLLQGLFRKTDLPARYGGEEFAVVLPETPAVAAQALAEKLREQAEKKIFAPQGERISLTISIGAATVEAGIQSQNLTEEELILAADQALYRAKHTGRNRVETWQWDAEH